MKDLSKIAGFNLKSEGAELIYDQAVFPVEPKVRTMDEARDVYQAKDEPQIDLYYMYRFFENTDDSEKFEKAQVEYDITVFNDGKVGEEFIKTVGHYHGLVPGTEITYPEVYEVLDGNVEFLLQSMPDDNESIDVVIVKASVGDKIVVPPNYGHITVNIGGYPAVTSNIQFRDGTAGAHYEFYPEHQGGALYRIEKGWEDNPGYNVSNIREVIPKEKSEWGLTKDLPLYKSFIESPEKFDFIKNPQNYDFSSLWRSIEHL